MTNRFDAIIIGAGQAGPALADRLTKAGKTVAVIERDLFGGTCVNTGCMPTKTLVASARAAHIARRAADFGVMLGGEIAVDMKIVQGRAAKVSATARGNVEKWLRGMPGCTVIQGHARFTGPHSVAVGDATIEAPQIFINVGGRALMPDMPGIDQVETLTNTQMVALDTLPAHLVVIGGSYIGLEFAQMYRRFGAKVTVIERQSRLIAREDPEISEAVQQILEREGIEMRLGAECISFTPDANGIRVGVDCTNGDRAVIGSHVLLAIGRVPNTGDLGLEAAGITLDARGYIPVDDHLRTSVEGIWAMGDCNGRGAFTHTSYNDFEIVAANLLDGEPRKASDRLPCYALFTDPPLARVGLSETEARASGRPLLIAKRPMARVGRAVEMDETQGFMKAIVDAETKRILGATILGISGDEAIHAILATMYADAPYTTLTHNVAIHPTVSELIPTLLGSLAPA